ncbi:MAG TPA: sarcosine oxidase subunit delta [Steroidobacteraceae bacterium]
MLRIECPWCGARDEPEFTYGGEAHISRPPAKCSDEEWSRYLFFRSNPKGEHAERWCHTYGCGQWFNVVRDTVTHEIKATRRMGEAR